MGTWYFSIATIVACLVLVFLILHPINLIFKLKRKNIINKKKAKLDRKYGEYFNVFKTYKRIQYQFGFFEFIRKLLFSFSLVYLHDYPSIQLMSIIFYNFTYLVLLIC